MKPGAILALLGVAIFKVEAVDLVDPIAVRIEPISDKFALRIEEVVVRNMTKTKELVIIGNSSIHWIITSDFIGDGGKKITSYKVDDIDEDGTPELIFYISDNFGKGVSVNMTILSFKNNHWQPIFNEQQSRWAAHVYPSQKKLADCLQ